MGRRLSDRSRGFSLVTASRLGRLKIATGIATLAAATVILLFSGGIRRRNVNLQASAKIIPLVLAGVKSVPLD